MGANLSSLKAVRTSLELRNFFSDEVLDDEAIQTFLKFNIKPLKTVEECKSLEEICADIKKEIATESTNNLTTLVEATVNQDIFETVDDESLQKIYNGLFFIKWFFLAHTEDKDKLIDVKIEIEALIVPFLIKILINLEISDRTYHITTEASDLLAILFDISPKIDLFENEKQLVQSLLKNFIDQQPAPVFPFGQQSGFGHALASGMWSVMTVGMGSMNETVDLNYKPLSHISIALLAKLVDSDTLCNSALCSMADTKETNFSDLHYILLSNEQFTPFLKKMLRSNIAYRKFVIMATDLSLVIGPVLKDIYNYGDEDYNNVSDKFELLQILSKDELFNQAIHSCSKSGSIIWYKEKQLKNIKLGGMVVIVLLRSVLQNKYDTIFQKTCMNILVQMSEYFSLLDFYPSERLVGCLEFLLKKHSRLLLSSEFLDASNVEDLVKKLLVIINNALVNQTQNNPNLVYSLLYKKTLITSFTNQNEEFVQHFLNVENLLQFTSSKIEANSEDPNGIMDTSILLGVIQNAISEYPSETFHTSKQKEVLSPVDQEDTNISEDVSTKADIVQEINNEHGDKSSDIIKEDINEPIVDEGKDGNSSEPALRETEGKETSGEEKIETHYGDDTTTSDISTKEIEQDMIETSAESLDNIKQVEEVAEIAISESVVEQVAADTEISVDQVADTEISVDQVADTDISHKTVEQVVDITVEQDVDTTVSDESIQNDAVTATSDKLVEQDTDAAMYDKSVVQVAVDTAIPDQSVEKVASDTDISNISVKLDETLVTQVEEVADTGISDSLVEQVAADTEISVDQVDDTDISHKTIEQVVDNTVEQDVVTAIPDKSIKNDADTPTSDTLVEQDADAAMSDKLVAQVAVDTAIPDQSVAADTDISNISVKLDETLVTQVADKIIADNSVEQDTLVSDNSVKQEAGTDTSDNFTEQDSDISDRSVEQVVVITAMPDQSAEQDVNTEISDILEDDITITVEENADTTICDAIAVEKEMIKESILEISDISEVTNESQDATETISSDSIAINEIKNDTDIVISDESDEIKEECLDKEINVSANEEAPKEVSEIETTQSEKLDENKDILGDAENIISEEAQLNANITNSDVSDITEVEQNTVESKEVKEFTNIVNSDATQEVCKDAIVEIIGESDVIKEESTDVDVVQTEITVVTDAAKEECQEIGQSLINSEKPKDTKEDVEDNSSNCDIKEEDQSAELDANETVEESKKTEQGTKTASNNLIALKEAAKSDLTISDHSTDNEQVETQANSHEVIANICEEAAVTELIIEDEHKGDAQEEFVNTENIVQGEIVKPDEKQENIEEEQNKEEQNIHNEEEESNTLVEFQAFRPESETPVTFLIEPKMLEKILSKSGSRIIITDFEVESSIPTRNQSGDSAVCLDSGAEEKETASSKIDQQPDIYTEFADQQRKINFAGIHNEHEKPTASKLSPRTIPVEALSANLYLAGSNIKFDLDDKLKICGTPVSPCANVIWQRAAMV